MAEQQEQDFSKLSLDEKLAHKVWKARLQGYEEATKLFKRLDEDSSEFSKFAGKVKKFVIDSNAVAQERGLEATLAFVEFAAPGTAARTCGDVVSGVVTKCLNARPKTKEAGINICLMFVEIEQQEVVQEEILKGLSNKQPKIVTACILVLRLALEAFGAKVMNMKQLMKALPGMFEHSDKNVRAEAKALAIEVYRWIGAAMKPSLEKSLKPVQLKELEEEWGKLPAGKATPIRLLRSQQQAQAAAAPTGGGGGGEGGGEEEGGGDDAEEAEIDPFDLADPVDMLSQMPKDFHEKIVDPKWKERKEVLEAILPLSQSMKLQPGDYGELVRALKKVISKDSNVMVVALAGNIVAGLAKGLRKHYHTYASATMTSVFEKFKEKKQNVVSALRDAADAVYLTTNLTDLQEQTVEALNSKNPSVKTETLLFLARCYQQCTPASLPKPLLKVLCPLMVQRLDDTTPQVREASCEALGTVLKVVGDRPMNPYLDGVDKTKLAKIQEHREKMELKIRIGVITSPDSNPPAPKTEAAKPKPKPAKPPEPAAERPPEASGGGGDTSLEISFDEPSKPIRKKPALSSQKKVKKDDDEGGAADTSLEVSFDEPSKPMKKKPVLSSQKRVKKEDDEGGAADTSLEVSFDEPSKPVKKRPALSSQKRVKKEDKDEGEEAASGAPPPASEPKPKKPASSGPPKKKPAASGGGAKASGGGKGKGKGKGATGMDAPPDQPEPAIAAEEVEEKAAAVLPKGLLDMLADTKWKDRLEACEKFQEFVEGLPGDEMQSHLFCKVLARKPGWKDSNFQVMKAKFAVVATLAQRAKVFGKRSTACVLTACVEKFADAKIKPQSAETLMTMAERMTLNYISLQVMKAAFEQKSPKVQSESLEWLGQALREFGFLINIKPFIDYIKKAFGATNPTVRTSAINLLSTIHMYIGAQLRMFFEDEKPALLQQIDAAFEKVSGESPPAPTRGPNVAGEDDEEGDEEAGEGGGGAAAAPVSLADLMPKVDISGQLKADLIKELGDKNWKIRGEALQKVQTIIASAKFIQPSLGELPGALKGRLGDSNKNLIVTTLGIIGSLATAMGSACSKFCRAFIPGVFGALADSKPQVRQAAIGCLNTWHAEITLVPFVEQEHISNALATENPTLRIELFTWLEEKLPAAGKLPSELSAIVPLLFSCLEDRSGDVRKKAQVALPLVMAKVGYDTMLKHAGKLKPASKQLVKGLMDKHRAAAPPPQAKAKQPPASASPPSSKGTAEKEDKPEKVPKKDEPKKKAAAPEDSGSGGGSGGGASTKKTARAGSAAKGKPTRAGKGKGGDEPAGPPLVLVPNGKEQRMRDEEKMKTLKWNFNLPRAEHIDQLKEQLQPCVSPALYSQLFHDDFKHHLAAIATLTKSVSGDAPHKEAAVGCLDLLLRWITLRFFETNTSINLKSLDFLHALFKMLVQVDSYRMSDYEANAFLPYLVQKVGDAKEPVRKGVRTLFRELCSFYPPAKLFTFVLDGLKSKNARQRTECLETLSELIQNNGMIVCGASPQKTLPLIAAQITDRDHAVRSAALNNMVIIYGYVGEAVYKFTSQLSEKEISLLEERIRRSSKKPPSAQQPAATPAAPPTTETPPTAKEPTYKAKLPEDQKPSSSTEPPPSAPAPEQERTSPPLPAHPEPRPLPRRPTGPFQIDMQKYAVPSPGRPNGALKLQRVDQSLLYEPDIQMPSLTTSRLVANPPIPVTISPARMASTSAAINFIISQITSSDNPASLKALRQIEVVISTPSQRVAVKPHIDQLLRAVLMQMRMNFTTPLAKANDQQSQGEVMELGKKLTSCLVSVFSEPSLASAASQESLIEVEHDIMSYLVDERLLKLEDVAQLIRTFNYLMLRLCENCDKTALFGSLLQVLLKSVNADGSSTRLTEMAMKCLWKITRQLPQLLPAVKVDQLLREVHFFFQGYTQLVPAPTPNDTPYRTVKTVLFHLTNIIGTEVLDHLTLIKDAKSSRVTQYVKKTLAKKRLSAEKVGGKSATDGDAREAGREAPSYNKPLQSSSQNPKPNQPSPFASASLPPGASQTIAEIYRKIGAPETTREGMLELYQFKQQHPSIDLATLQSRTTKFFQAYIERGLKSIECELSASGTSGEAPLGDSSFANSLKSDDCKERVRALEAIRLRASRLMNIDWESKDKPAAPEGVLTTEAPAMDPAPRQPVADENKPSLPRPKTQSQLRPPGGSKPGGGSLDLDSLKKRLDRLKGTT